MTGQIFISYRRQESGWSARSLHDRLCREFDPGQIFMDLDAIALGEDFVDAIEATVARCDVLVAVIGNNWLTSKDERGGRRLDNAEDFVRMEIGTALKRKVRVIPVLVDGALMPRADDLPQDLKPIVRRNALSVTTISFEGDCQRLAGAIRQVLERAAAEERERLASEQRQREEAEARQREEKERLEAEQREKERLEDEQREKERLKAKRLEKERLGAEQREKERLAAEARQRQIASKGNIPSRSAAPSQNHGPVQTEAAHTDESKGPVEQMPLKQLAVVLGFPLILVIVIFGLMWFVGSNLNHSGRNAAMVTPTLTPTPVTPTATSIAVSAPTTLPSDVQTYFDHGRADFLWKNYDDAISDYTKVISLDARNAEAYYNRGLAYRQLGKDAQAQADFGKAKQLGYTGSQVTSTATSGGREPALVTSTATPTPVEPVSKLPSDVQTYFDHGRADFLWKNYDEAISDYTKVIRLDARSAEAYYNRGLAYRQLGKDAQAQADFGKAKQLGYTGSQ